MPILTLKYADITGTGGLLDAVKVMENLYEPDVTTPDTFEIIDGWLDTSNRPDVATDPLDYSSLQPGTFIRVGQRGSTVAFDLFDDLFPRNNFLPNAPNDPLANFIALPGAQIRFYLPFAPTGVLFSWMVNWTTDIIYIDGNDYTAQCAPAHFAVDGKSTIATPHSHRRVAVATITQLGTAAGFAENVWPRVSQADQKWSGHKYVTGLAAGWHTAGIFIGVSDAFGDGPDGGDIAQQARVRSRSIRYIAFK